MLSSFVKLLVLVTLGARPTWGQEGEFNYAAGGDRGPEKWGDLKPEWAMCKTGVSQSPVDISSDNIDTVTSIGQLTRSYKSADATLAGGNYVEIDWDGDAGSIELDQSVTYSLTRVHWHAPSEHIINGERFDLEMHMVHTNGNSIIVFAYLYRTGGADSFISSITGSLEQLRDSKSPVKLAVDPNTITTYGSPKYRYKGSLTTPPCSEDVTWLVSTKILSVSSEQIDLMNAAHGDNGEGNSRPVQPINDRRILNGPFS